MTNKEKWEEPNYRKMMTEARNRRPVKYGGMAIRGSKDHNFYRVYHTMRHRCENPKSSQYPNYGGRGIKVEWNSFAEFQRDMFPTYKKGLSLDRIDNDGNYSRNNCRWATAKQQTTNYRKNITACMKDLCTELGFSYSKIRSQVLRGKGGLAYLLGVEMKQHLQAAAAEEQIAILEILSEMTERSYSGEQDNENTKLIRYAFLNTLDEVARRVRSRQPNQHEKEEN